MGTGRVFLSKYLLPLVTGYSECGLTGERPDQMGPLPKEVLKAPAHLLGHGSPNVFLEGLGVLLQRLTITQEAGMVRMALSRTPRPHFLHFQ